MPGIYGIPESFSPEPEAPSPERPAPSRHPRPDRATVNHRDGEVLALVESAGTKGISRTAVAEIIGLTMHEAYLSLNRVQHTGRIKNIRRNNAHVWIVVSRAEGE